MHSELYRVRNPILCLDRNVQVYLAKQPYTLNRVTVLQARRIPSARKTEAAELLGSLACLRLPRLERDSWRVRGVNIKFSYLVRG